MLNIATFNIENLDDKPSSSKPSLAERIPVLQAALNRMDAQIICLQEVHGQELPGHTTRDPERDLAALGAVLAGTPYETFERVSTLTSDNVPYNERNLVILSAFPVLSFEQYRNDHIDTLLYRRVTATDPKDGEAKVLRWERPILHAQIQVPVLGKVHIINLHLKSRLATNVPGQREGYLWRSAAGWAEGSFLSSIKRVGQALETRVLIDSIFDQEPDARILVCGDFNAGPGEVPVETICGRVENTNNPALRSRVLVSCSRNIPDSVRFSHYHHGHGNLLDHVLMSQAVLPYFRYGQIHNENLHDESLPFMSDLKYPESDHAPFVAAFDVPIPD